MPHPREGFEAAHSFCIRFLRPRKGEYRFIRTRHGKSPRLAAAPLRHHSQVLMLAFVHAIRFFVVIGWNMDRWRRSRRVRRGVDGRGLLAFQPFQRVTLGVLFPARRPRRHQRRKDPVRLWRPVRFGDGGFPRSSVGAREELDFEDEAHSESASAPLPSSASLRLCRMISTSFGCGRRVKDWKRNPTLSASP